MHTALTGFVEVLRGAGVRVSTSETLDALQAVRLVGYGSREQLHDALATTLVKRHDDTPVFDARFEAWFAQLHESPASAATTDHPHSPAPAGAHTTPSQTLNAIDGMTLSPLANILRQGNAAALQMAMHDAAAAANTAGIRFMTQRGLFARRMMMAMGSNDLDADIQRLRERATPEADTLAGQLGQARDTLRTQVRTHVDLQLKLQGEGTLKRLREDSVLDASLQELRDLPAVLPIVRRLARQLVTRQQRRMKVRDRGRLDVHRTLRRSLVTDGVPMQPVFKTRRIDRPKVMLVCDVSGSVANAARFLLCFVYAMVDGLRDVRAFAFSSSAGEVSDWFKTLPAPDAVARTLERHGQGSTDYARAFDDVRRLAGQDIDRHTTVIILGDARNNYGPHNAEALAHIKRRAHRVLWLNPEARNRWGSGDSEMPRYLAHITRAGECRNLRQLAHFAATLLKTHP